MRSLKRNFSIWPCSKWGLPCRYCYQQRGALLPHLFTLARRRCIFCGTFHELTLSRCYLAPCLMEPGLSSVKNSDRLTDSGTEYSIFIDLIFSAILPLQNIVFRQYPVHRNGVHFLADSYAYPLKQTPEFLPDQRLP